MFSPVKAIITGAVVFALGGVFLIAQPFDQQGGVVPGAEDPVTATHVVGTVTGNTTESGGDWSALDGLITNRDAAYEHIVEWSDPRLPATMRFSENLNRYDLGGGAGAMAFVGNIRFEDSDGAWTGPEYGLAEESDAGFVQQPRMMLLTGEGAYEGLTAMLQRRYEPDDVSFTRPVFEGYIFDGEMPPMPEPLEPSAE